MGKVKQKSYGYTAKTRKKHRQLKHATYLPVIPLKPFVKITLLILTIAALFTVGMHLNQSLQKDGTILTYKRCTQTAGSRITNVINDPKICTMPDGRYVVNPADQVNCVRSGYTTSPHSCR